MATEIEEIYSTKEIAQILGTNQTAVRLLIKDGTLEAMDISRGSKRPVWKITQTQLNKHLDKLGIKYEVEA